MSVPAFKYATGILKSDIRLAPTAQLVLRELAWRHDLTKEKRYPMSALANELGKEKPNIHRAIKQLLQADVIWVLPEPNRLQRTPQLYKFCDPFDLNVSGAETVHISSQTHLIGLKKARQSKISLIALPAALGSDRTFAVTCREA
ncbi:MAG: hypothetical protein ABJI96_16835 [Paracoccaceae bacterium]